MKNKTKTDKDNGKNQQGKGEKTREKNATIKNERPETKKSVSIVCHI